MLWVLGGAVLAILSIAFMVLLWSTLDAAREFYQRENRKHITDD